MDEESLTETTVAAVVSFGIFFRGHPEVACLLH